MAKQQKVIITCAVTGAIHTPVGTFTMPYSLLTSCSGSRSVVKVAVAASYHGPAASSPPASCAAATISKPGPPSSA